jgi:hypothetical protein
MSALSRERVFVSRCRRALPDSAELIIDRKAFVLDTMVRKLIKDVNRGLVIVGLAPAGDQSRSVGHVEQLFETSWH